ncbi:hypothetical protein CKCBHOJB_00748 [Thauera sp. GDN1]|uniref:DUF3426 domain-containing protein n=1 Tax=Thauera sp. GDN1 TaxID=2944810 RepID=UPI002479D32D|nr:DUF3426 domain-containing protein [Thauera sp. GDN1]WEN41206.1 hypothetical protein CKCBHOJB_00748 [Thauera sp. GDN1]
MMLTRCPACQTVFRLRPEQLQARGGEVRCGHCYRPFNALEHALEMPATEETPPTPPPAAQAADTPPPRVFPGVLRSGRRPPPPGPLADADTLAVTTAATSSTPPPPEAEAEETPPAAIRHDPADTLDAVHHEPDLARLDAAYGRPQRTTHPVLKAVGGLLVLVLTALLGAQSAYLYRMEIARELPGLRPLLAEACAHFGCSIPYPQDAERIAIEASDLQSEPGKRGHYLLHATLNNRAEYPQRWPHLELTLTDAGDKPISRRVLAPAEWQNPGETREAFPARTAIELRLPFQVPGLAPTGYRIYAFYP